MLVENHGLAVGRIDAVRGSLLSGWLYSPLQDVHPLLTVGGRPAELVMWPLLRPDVQHVLGTDAETGYTFKVHHARAGERVVLSAVVGDRIVPVAERKLERALTDLRIISQLEHAAAVCRDPDSVAVTCWDAGHNAIGRAKVLYDVASLSNPTVLFAYGFPELGESLWPPLRQTDLDLVVIPWQERHVYHDLIRRMGIAFPHVWMCKPRLPTFLMTAQIASPEARLVLDLDDNEDHLARSTATVLRAYGVTGSNLSNRLRDRINARTVASVSLKAEFGGRLVRHARPSQERGQDGERRSRPHPRRRKHRLAFLGTVRPHKNVLEAAHALRVLGWSSRREYELHVIGDVTPDSLRAQLLQAGVVVGDVVAVDEACSILREMDAVLTGFPPSTPEHEAIAHYQVSSKIGDALSVGRPVLVPRGHSVADLVDVPGVFLFDHDDFAAQLEAALSHQGRISLPDDFTLPGANAGWRAALDEAAGSPPAASLLQPTWSERSTFPVSARRRNFLLLWKQNDAGLYGRRVDQAARALKRAHASARVTVLETCSQSQYETLLESRDVHCSEAGLVLSLLDRKTGPGHVDGDGVEYRTVRYGESSDLASALTSFLASNRFLPSDTHLVTYPILPSWERFVHVLEPYPQTVDVVDNQLSFAKSTRTRGAFAAQYAQMLARADRVVFNSRANLEYLDERYRLGSNAPWQLIPNWYQLPRGEHPRSDTHSTPPTVMYSGNMSDRVDWGLLQQLAAADRDLDLLLVGSARQTALEGFLALLEHPNVTYLGPETETQCLSLLRTVDVALLPHTVDDVSRYMNPMKPHMYRAMGVPTVATHVPGTPAPHPLLRTTAADDFVATVLDEVSHSRSRRPTTGRILEGKAPPDAERFVQTVDVGPVGGRRIT